MTELRIANLTAYAWQSLVGPAEPLNTLVRKLSAKLQATLALSPYVTQQLTDMSVIFMSMPSAEFKAHVRQKRAAWERVIKKVSIKLE